jgi:hypothetical protein
LNKGHSQLREFHGLLVDHCSFSDVFLRSMSAVESAWDSARTTWQTQRWDLLERFWLL